MKVVFFMGSMCRGGAERVISILSNDFCARGWDVQIALLLRNKVEYELDPRIQIVDLTGKHTSYIKNAASWIGKIRKFLKDTHPDRVVSFAGRINALVLTAAAGLKLPVIVSERNDPKHDGRGRLMRWYCDIIYFRAKAIVFQNKYEQSCFCASHKSRSYVIPNPIHVTALKKQKETDDRVIATAGRLTGQKNQKILISAMKKVCQVYPQTKCRIYGDGELQNSLQEQINDLQLQAAVSLEGNVADIHERLAQSDLFVMTSEFEGLSNALVEAMMMGLPCISTNYPGVEELILNNENGLLVPCGDDTALAEAIIKLIADSAFMERLAQKAKETAEDYRVEVVIDLWRKVIEL